MIYTFEVQNIKCGGCVANITNNLQGDDRISRIEIDLEKGIVTIESDSDASSEWLQKMTELGYPPK